MDMYGVILMRCKFCGKFIEVEIDLEFFELDLFFGCFFIFFLVVGYEVGGYYNEGWFGDLYGFFQDLFFCMRDFLKCFESCFNKRKNVESDGFKLLFDSYVCGLIFDLDFNMYYFERKGELLCFYFINEVFKYIFLKNFFQGIIELLFGVFVVDIFKISEEYFEKCFLIEMEIKVM